MEAIRRIFFNGVESSDRKTAWISWKNVLASKKIGGLGVSSFYALNRALLYKWVSRFITQGSSVWSRFIKAIYGDRGALDSFNSIARRSTWLDIVREVSTLSTKGIDLLSFVKKKVGNGEDTLFWDDIWLDEKALKYQYPRLYALELHKYISVAGKMHHSSLAFSFRRDPKGGVEDRRSSIIFFLHVRITGLLLPNMRDRWVWSLEASGEFLVKTVRILLVDSFLPKVDIPTRWVKAIPIMINIFAWRVRLDKLPTRLNLSLRGVEIISILCPLCGTSVELASHIFFSCPLARQVRSKLMRWWELDDPIIHSYEDRFCWLNNLRMSKGLKEVFEGVCYVMWWLLWCYRILLIFGENLPRRDLLFDYFVQLSFNCCSSRRKSYLEYLDATSK